MLDHDLHVQPRALVQRRDVQLGVDDLHVRIGCNISGGDFALAVCVDYDLLGLVAMQLAAELLEVKDDLGNVFLYTLNDRKLMQHAINANAGDRHAGQAGEQNAAHGIP